MGWTKGKAWSGRGACDRLLGKDVFDEVRPEGHRKGVGESEVCRKEAPAFWKDGIEGRNCRQTGREAGPGEMEQPGAGDLSCYRTWQWPCGGERGRRHQARWMPPSGMLIGTWYGAAVQAPFSFVDGWEV